MGYTKAWRHSPGQFCGADTRFRFPGWSLVPFHHRIGLESCVSSLECQGASERKIRSPRSLVTHFFLSLEFLFYFPGAQVGHFISECVHARNVARPFSVVHTLPHERLAGPVYRQRPGLARTRRGTRLCPPQLVPGPARGKGKPVSPPQAVPLGSGLGTASLPCRCVHVMPPSTWQGSR